MISSIRLVALVTICICETLHFSDGQVILSGSCPSIPVMPKFNASAYMGLWHEVAKYPARFETGGKCITADYELLEDGTVKVVNSQYNIPTQSTIQIEGSAEVVGNAKLLVQFPGQPTPTGSNYWVLETDYRSYSVVLSCVQSTDETHALIVWILTRDRVPTMDTAIKALVVLTSNNLPLNYLTITDQDDC